MPLPRLGIRRQSGRVRVGTPLGYSSDEDDDAYRAPSLLCRDRTRRRRPVLTQDAPCRLRRSDDRALRAASPVVTEDLQPSAPLSDEKLVSAVAETASAVTLQEVDDSSSKELLDTTLLQESISASPGTVPHNIIDASWRPSTSSCEKLVAGASESASAQTLGEADVSSLEELINTASLQELVTASPRTAPCNNALDGSSSTSPLRHEKTVAGVAESAHAQAMRELELELDQFIEEDRLGYSSSEDQTTTASPRAAQHNTIQSILHMRSFADESEKLSGLCASPPKFGVNTIDGRNQRTVLRNTMDGTPPSASSPGSKILSRRIPHCFYWYYIRMDRQGSFRMYPDLGGPFQSLQEAEDAINRHHDELWRQACWHTHPTVSSAVLNSSETRTSPINLFRQWDKCKVPLRYELGAMCKRKHQVEVPIRQLGIKDLARELDEDAMMEQWIYEDHSYYYHYNFTTKKNEAGDISLGACTFFAEVSHKLGEHALEVNCCCKMEDEDNGWCYGCKNNGSHGMRHPKNSDAYTGGHLDVFLPCTLEEPSSSDDEEAKETRLRNISKDNPLSCMSGSLFRQ